MSVLLNLATQMLQLFLLSFGIYHFAMAFVVFRVARYRSLPLSWFAWLPIGQDYVLGALADDLGGGRDRIFRGGESYYRHILAGLKIVSTFLTAIVIVAGARGLDLNTMLLEGPASQLTDAVLDVASFAATGVQAYVLYKIYGYFQAERASLYALLSIFLGFLTPILLFVVSRKRIKRSKESRHDDYFPPNPPSHF